MANGSKGQWPAGKSGNAQGRPKKKEPKLLETYEDLAEVIMKVANRKTTVKIEGRDEVVSVAEMNAIRLASGSGSDRLAPKAFIDFAKAAARTLDYARKQKK